MFREGVPMTRMEVEFQRRTAAMPGLTFAALIEPPPFTHIGAHLTFNPSNLRHRRIERLQALPVVGRLVCGARQVIGRIRKRR